MCYGQTRVNLWRKENDSNMENDGDEDGDNILLGKSLICNNSCQVNTVELKFSMLTTLCVTALDFEAGI